MISLQMVFDTRSFFERIAVMDELFVRKPSCLECFYMDFNDCGYNMTFHYFLKLDRMPDLAILNETLKKTLITHSGINLKFKNKAWYTSLSLPECKVVEFDGDCIYDFKGSCLNFRVNTIALSVIHLTKKGGWFLCFDFFHGAVDGRSGVQFIYDFFAVLNNKPTEENDFSLIENDIVKKNKSKKTLFNVLPVCKPKDWKPKKEGESMVQVLTTNACTRYMAAKLSKAISHCFSSNKAHMIIPVDIRRFYGETKKKLFGNLILPIFINAHEGKDMNDLSMEVSNHVKKKTLLSKTTANLFFYNKLPIRLRRAVLRFLISLVMASKKFIYCALVSPVGQIHKEKLESTHFEVEDIAVTFISFPFTAFSVVSVQYDGHTNTSISWHSGRVPQKVAAALAKEIDDCISE